MRREVTSNLYIWQRDDWPNFTWNSDRILQCLGRVRQLQGQLSGVLSAMGFKVRERAELSALTEDLVSSSAIEGVVLNVDSVRSSVARRLGIDTELAAISDHYTEGLVEMMMDAVAHSDEPLTDERIFGWHTALFPFGRSGIHRIMVGEWRIGEEPMQVVSGAMGHEKVHYQAPPSREVPDEMNKFLLWAREQDLDPVIMAAVGAFWFITIHPFDDGNGRISRTIADYFLSRADMYSHRFYSVSAEILRDKKSYYAILEKTQRGNMDITEWVLWFISCLEKALLRANKLVDGILRKASYWDCFWEVSINERQRKVINKLWDGFDGKLTASKWAKICHISTDTALRDINDLLNKKMLVVGPEGGRSTHYLLPSEWN